MLRNRLYFILCTAFLTGLGAAACSDDLLEPEPLPAPAATDIAEAPLNPLDAALGTAECMGDDAVNAGNVVSGFGTNPLAFNCTANDISLANAETASGDPIPCVPGQPILNVDIVADIIQTSNSTRSDIGIWIENGDNMDGGAESGSCDFFYFDQADIDDEAGVTSSDSPADQCGDMDAAARVDDFLLGGLDLVCPENPVIVEGKTYIEIASCVSWTQPGGDRVCPIPGEDKPNATRWGTLPANKSKCNCDPFLVEVDIQAQLTLLKTVVNDDGGTAVDTDWTLQAASTGTTISGVEGAASITNAVVPSGSYALSESGGPAGYAAGSWSCTGTGSQTGSNIALDPGEMATCTITNDDIAPTLTLVKTVTNDGGGTSVANDWDLTATGTSATFTELTPAAADATARNVTAGVEYTLSESGPSGYSAGNWSCTGDGTQDGDKITLGVDDDATCTINNDDQPATLKLVKTVTNDNGGTSVANDWDLTATGSSNSFTEMTPAAADATASGVTAGVQYTLTESGPSGYTAGSWSCDGGTQADDKITVGLNQNVTCTIDNDDIAPTLTLVKTVTNDGGGTNVPNDWALTATGTSATFTELTPAAADATARNVTAGVEYTLSESGPSGYSAGNWSCTGDGTQDGDKITLGVDEDATCTINNDDDPATLTLVKIVDNSNGGGTAVADDFQGMIDGNSVPWGVAQSLGAGSFTASETLVAGYTAGSWTGDCAADGSVTLALGDAKTCTITNTSPPPPEVCEAGDRVTSVTLLLVSSSSDPESILIGVTDDNGQSGADLDGFPREVTSGETFTVVPDDGATFFDSQNLRFTLDGVMSKDLKVHLSCSDDPEVGDQHSGTAGSASVTLEKTALITTSHN